MDGNPVAADYAALKTVSLGRRGLRLWELVALGRNRSHPSLWRPEPHHRSARNHRNTFLGRGRIVQVPLLPLASTSIPIRRAAQYRHGELLKCLPWTPSRWDGNWERGRDVQLHWRPHFGPGFQISHRDVEVHFHDSQSGAPSVIPWRAGWGETVLTGPRTSGSLLLNGNQEVSVGVALRHSRDD